MSRTSNSQTPRNHWSARPSSTCTRGPPRTMPDTPRCCRPGHPAGAHHCDRRRRKMTSRPRGSPCTTCRSSVVETGVADAPAAAAALAAAQEQREATVAAEARAQLGRWARWVETVGTVGKAATVAVAAVVGAATESIESGSNAPNVWTRLLCSTTVMARRNRPGGCDSSYGRPGRCPGNSPVCGCECAGSGSSRLGTSGR